MMKVVLEPFLFIYQVWWQIKPPFSIPWTISSQRNENLIPQQFKQTDEDHVTWWVTKWTLWWNSFRAVMNNFIFHWSPVNHNTKCALQAFFMLNLTPSFINFNISSKSLPAGFLITVHLVCPSRSDSLIDPVGGIVYDRLMDIWWRLTFIYANICRKSSESYLGSANNVGVNSQRRQTEGRRSN